MQVRFWGVRGSLPSPDTTGELEARLLEIIARLGQEKAPPDLQDAAAVRGWIQSLPAPLRTITGGNTPCVEMRTANGDLFIVDAGTGLRPFGNELMAGDFGQGQGHAHVFFSHYHWDHLQGLPFFRPIYIRGNRFDLYARHEKLEEHLRHQQQAPFFPPASWDDIQAELNYHQLDAEPIELCEGRVRVSSIALDHPSRAYAYRFETDGKVFIYASDGAYHDLDEDAITLHQLFQRRRFADFRRAIHAQRKLRKAHVGPFVGGYRRRTGLPGRCETPRPVPPRPRRHRKSTRPPAQRGPAIR